MCRHAAIETMIRPFNEPVKKQYKPLTQPKKSRTNRIWKPFFDETVDFWVLTMKSGLLFA
jgi:hypothetical protein